VGNAELRFFIKINYMKVHEISEGKSAVEEEKLKK
jgi:hypothetical protein